MDNTNNIDHNTIPIISYSNLLSNQFEVRKNELNKLKSACHLIGFFYLIDVQFDFE